MFLLGVTSFSLASICCALSPSVFWLIGARVLQGASAPYSTHRRSRLYRSPSPGVSALLLSAFTGALSLWWR